MGTFEYIFIAISSIPLWGILINYIIEKKEEYDRSNK